MPVPNASKHRRVEAPVVANAGRGSKLKAPVAPGPPKKNSRTKVLAATKVLNPQDFVCIQALPGFAQKEGKVLARSRTIYKSSEPPREQVFWENYYRRQKQFTQGHFTPLGKPYRELGEILYTDPKKLTLYSLGQLAQEPVKKEGQEELPKEVAEVTTDEDSFNPEFDHFQSDPLEPVKRLSPFRETGKELRTLSKALAHSRHHINSVKQGGDYFHILHQESLERKNTLKAAQQAQGTRWRTEFQPPKYSSDEEESEGEINTYSLIEGNHLRKSGKKKKKMTLRSFTPVYTSVLIPSPPGAKSEHLFRQLCAIHWLLEALTLESNSSMHSILTCWNPRRQEERCYQKYEALKQLKYFRRDMERIRRLSMRAEREHDEGGLNWFLVLLARLPESVKSDHYVQKILKKLEKYSKIPDLKIHPDTFLKALADLQVWELCSPEIASAVEFVRESIVQMPEEDFSEWFQTRVAPLSAQSSTF